MAFKVLEFNSIVICDDLYKSFLIDYKNKNINLNFKILSPNEVYDMLDYYFSNDAIKHIIKNKKCSYKSAKEICNYLHFISEDNNFDDLYKLKKELINKDFCVSKIYEQELFKNKKIYLLEEEKNQELQFFLDKHNINYEFINIKELIQINTFNVFHSYKNKYEQFYDVINIICSLLNNGVDVNKIKIRGDVNEYIPLIKYFEKNSNLKFKYSEEVSLLNNIIIQKELKTFFENKKIAVLDNIYDEKIGLLNSLITEYDLSSFEFKFAYNLLMELLGNVKTKLKSESGIEFSSNFNFKNDDYVFELNFDLNSFPQIYDDTGYYKDSVLEKLNINPSFIKSKLDKINKINIINCTFYYGLYVEFKDNKKVEISSLTNDLFFSRHEKSSNNFIKNPAILNYYLNSKEFNNNIEKEVPYKYSFKYNGSNKNYLPNRFSYSSLNEFVQCGFKYYLDHVLKIKDINEDNFNNHLGLVVHRLFESIYNKDFDYDIEFEKAINDIYFNLSDKEKFFFTNIIKDRLKIILDRFISNFKFQTFSNKWHEYKFNIDINYLNKNIEFNGSIDSVLLNNNTYTILDYKTGRYHSMVKKDIDCGIPNQLIFYYFALANNNKNKSNKLNLKFNSNYSIGGIFYVPIKLGEFYEEESNSKFDGLIKNDQTYFNEIIDKPEDDEVLVDQRINRHTTKKNEYLVDIDAFRSMYFDKHYVDFIIYKFINDLNENKFDVLPIEDGCDYCPYKKICYYDGTINKELETIDFDSNEYKDILAKGGIK